MFVAENRAMRRGHKGRRNVEEGVSRSLRWRILVEVQRCVFLPSSSPRIATQLFTSDRRLASFCVANTEAPFILRTERAKLASSRLQRSSMLCASLVTVRHACSTSSKSAELATVIRSTSSRRDSVFFSFPLIWRSCSSSVSHSVLRFASASSAFFAFSSASLTCFFSAYVESTNSRIFPTCSSTFWLCASAVFVAFETCSK